MAIAFVGQTQVAGSSGTLPTGISVGNYILIFAYKTTGTAPALPGGYTNIGNATGGAQSIRVGYRVATGSDTSGTWTNATALQMVVYSGVSGIGSGSTVQTNPASASITVPSITLDDGSGNSWIVVAEGSKQTISLAMGTGVTQRGTNQSDGTGLAAIGDTNGGVSSWAGTTGTAGSSIPNAAASIELISATVTTTKNQTGKTRIQKTTSKTQMGVANIAPSTITTTKTQTGVARIQKTVTKTQSGVVNIIAQKEGWRDNTNTLSTTNSVLTTPLTATEMSHISTVDGVYVDETGSNTYNEFLFANYNASISSPTLTWTGKTTKDGSTATITLQIYNFVTPAWETLATNNTVAVNTDFTLSASQTTNTANYFDINGYVWGRVYQ